MTNTTNTTNYKYCRNCGSEIDARAVICPKCGVATGVTMQTKNEGLAAVLSFLVPGAGQIYNGQIIKGLVLFAAQLISIVLMAIGIGFITALIVWVYAIYNAYHRAKEINTGTCKDSSPEYIPSFRSPEEIEDWYD